MFEREQVRPLAPVASQIAIESPTQSKKSSHRKHIKCCGCVAAVILILAMIILTLVFTVFHVKDPDMKMNNLQVKGLDRVSNATPLSAINITVIVDVSIKNPNVASFKFGNSTTTVYYDAVAVGEGKNPPGVAKAKKTRRMNVTIDVMMGKVLGVGRLSSDLSLGVLPMSSYTRVGGKVKILNIFKKGVVVEMNCTMTVNITSQGIQDQNCKKSVSL